MPRNADTRPIVSIPLLYSASRRHYPPFNRTRTLYHNPLEKCKGGFGICVKGRISVIHANILRIGNNIDNFEEKHGLTRPRILSICFPHEGFGITVESRLDLVSTIGNPPYWAAAAAQLFTPQALAQLGYAFHCIQHVADARIIPVKRRIGHNGTASLQTRCAKPSE